MKSATERTAAKKKASTKIVSAKRMRGRPANSASVGPDLILRIARQTFARRGFEATSVREIARDCGVDPALVAHHFGSKDSLWTAVVQQIAEQALPLIAATAALRTMPLGARERVERAITLVVDQVFAEPDIGMFFSTAATEEGQCSDKLIEELVRPYHDVFVPLLSDAMKAGELSILNANLTFFMLINAISKTVSYGHVFAAFSSLVKHRAKYKRAVFETALKMLG